MHGTTIKIIDAQQAKLRNNYKNTKLKLLKTNAAIWKKSHKLHGTHYTPQLETLFTNIAGHLTTYFY
jgi:hypothetical protein